MLYSVLGPTQVHTVHGTPVALGGARLRALLTVLALRAGRIVPVGVLVDEVWDGAPPADGAAALQALVGRLRRALGREAVESSPGGYRLAAGPEDVDAHRFERLAGEGVRAFGAGDPVRAAELLDEALGLWRGPALADLPDRTAEAARWEARRLDARRARLDAALALGEGASVLPELAALCEAHPLDEPLQALRIRALRDTGRAAGPSPRTSPSAATWRTAWARTRPRPCARSTRSCCRRRRRPGRHARGRGRTPTGYATGYGALPAKPSRRTGAASPRGRNHLHPARRRTRPVVPPGPRGGADPGPRWPRRPIRAVRPRRRSPRPRGARPSP